MNRAKSNKGPGIVELLMILAIIGIIFAIAFTALQRERDAKRLLASFRANNPEVVRIVKVEDGGTNHLILTVKTKDGKESTIILQRK